MKTKGQEVYEEHVRLQLPPSPGRPAWRAWDQLSEEQRQAWESTALLQECIVCGWLHDSADAHPVPYRLP